MTTLLSVIVLPMSMLANKVYYMVALLGFISCNDMRQNRHPLESVQSE